MSEQNNGEKKEIVTTKKEVPAPIVQHTALYTVVISVVRVLMRTIIPVRYYHEERMKEHHAPYILIGNHLSMLDPFIMGGLVYDKQVVFLGKKELTKNPILRAILKGLHMIPVDRGHTDMAAMRSCNRLLKENGILGIFPEGTRHHEGVMKQVESGTGMIALRSGVPIVPVYIGGKPGLFKRVDCLVGEPISTEDLRAQGVNRESCEKLMARFSEVYDAMGLELEQLKRK